MVHNKDIWREAFRVVNTLEDDLSEKDLAAVLIRFLEITHKRVLY